MDIGRKIKQIRLQRDLTQEELASRTELTKGYISQLENDLCSPSISTLSDILNILGVKLQDFFSETEEKLVFKHSDYFESESGDCIITWLIPNSQKNDMEPIILSLPEDGGSLPRLPFEGEEFGYVLEGRVILSTVKGDFAVKKGECFSLDGKIEHRIVNSNKGGSKVLWITTPSNF